MATLERRRLTVGTDEGVAARGGATGRSPRGERTTPEGTQKKQAWDTIVNAMKDEEKGTWFYVASQTDRNLQRRRSFEEKDADKKDAAAPASKMTDFTFGHKVAWGCKKGMKPESPNQDTYVVLYCDKKWALYGVFDGHGQKGHEVSDFARDVLVKSFLEFPDHAINTGAAFTHAFAQTQNAIRTQLKPEVPQVSGSTCTMVYVNEVTKEVTTAHIGDSRCIVIDSKSNVLLGTVDHKPELPGERARIENSNPPGRVVHDGFYNYRLFAQGGMYPGLNMSRAFGDVLAHDEAGLSAEPEINSFNMDVIDNTGDPLTMFICSDGVWEFIENEEAPKVADMTKDIKASCDKIVKESYERWLQDSDNEISDDITALIVKLKTP